MPASQIDFQKIRTHRGDQRGGFEELCCQLAALEDPVPGCTFIRKGPGPDQGLECFQQNPDGREIGWQAKYFIDKFGDSQIRDIDDSLARALAAHPALNQFIVCLPIDLQDNRGKGKRLSQMQRFQAWIKKRVDKANAEGRDLEIKLWSASFIHERLGRDSPLYSGRLRYWFDATRLTKAWFAKKNEVSIRNLGERYTPKSHVELPIQFALRSLARDETFLRKPATWSDRIEQAFDSVKEALTGVGMGAETEQLWAALFPLLDALDASAPLGSGTPTDSWQQLAAAALEVAIDVLASCDELPPKSRPDLQRKLFAVYQSVEDVRSSVRGEPWALANKRQLVVTGQAGMGKSHLLADFGSSQIAQGRPFVLMLTSTMDGRDPWLQIREQLDLQDITTEEFLGAMDAAAEAQGCRAIIAVDALNEGSGLSFWGTRLQGFLSVADKFPCVAVVLTVRETYVGHFDFRGLPRVVHHGFAGHAADAAKVYLDQRGITRPSAPNMLKEFENPLFLRTCCDYLDAAGLNELPKGLSGITQLFDFYLVAITEKVQRSMELDHLRDIPRKALNGFLAACTADDACGALTKKNALAFFETQWPSEGRHSKSLLAQFLSEGVLTQDIVASDDEMQETVRFTFERFYDHLRAKCLLDKYSDPSDIRASFACEPLISYVEFGATWDHGGIVEALAVQLPERFGLEVFDVAPKRTVNDEEFVATFKNSLVWRKANSFTSHTHEWLQRVNDVHGGSIYSAYLLVCTEPDNPYNANFLHEHLMSLNRPTRDAQWSVYLATDDLSEDGPVTSLIHWAWEAQPMLVEQRRLLLACTALTWHLTTPNRAVRDMATKALVHLLQHDMGLSKALLMRFAQVDDPYVTERLLAAAYGASLQGADVNGNQTLAQTVWELYFAPGKEAPVHLIARDFAIGMLEYAHRLGRLPRHIDLAACRSSFGSPWPLEKVSEEDVEPFMDGGFHDSIVSSTSDHGDFGHYTVSRWLNEFTVMPRVMAGRSTKDIFKEWEEAFIEQGEALQLEAYVALQEHTLEYRQQGRTRSWESLGVGERDESERMAAALHATNEAFKSLLNPEECERYKVLAEHFLLESSRMGTDDIGPPELDPAPVRRWVCQRAHELGWAPDLFSAFESSRLLSRERIGRHRIERMGKKYQHIALAEATARIADHLTVTRFNERGQLRAFELTPGALSMMRDIDPSLLVRGTKETGWAATPVTWWTPTAVRLPVGPTAVLLAWLQVESDFVNDPQQIDVKDGSGQEWLVLDSFRHWREPGQNRRNHAEAWSRITCLVTLKGRGKELAEELASSHRGDVSRMAEAEKIECFLGEHGWRESRAPLRPQASKSMGIQTPHAGLISTLTCESLSSDNSIEDDFTLHLPSAGLMQLLDLRLRNGKAPEYVDAAGVTRQKDPSVNERGPGAALISRQFFLEGLERAGLEPVWVIAGEKNVYGGQSPGSQAFGGRIVHTTVYFLAGNAMKLGGHFKEEMPPRPEQLKELLEAEPRSDLG